MKDCITDFLATEDTEKNSLTKQKKIDADFRGFGTDKVTAGAKSPS